MKTKISILSALIVLFALFSGCEEDTGETGTVALSITDAPLDNDNIEGVWIKVNGLEYHTQDSGWKTFEGYEGPKEFNLLELTDGVKEMLGTFEMEAGQYNQLRFLMDIPDMGDGRPSNPGCYLMINGEKEPLFVPSGGQSGYKAVGAFQVPSNGTVELTADWDARKAVVKAGATDRYILRPTIRLIADNQAGTISGGISSIPDDASDIAVYAYEDNVDEGDIDDEAAEPTDEENRFPNAVTSDVADEEGNYQLNWLAPITYDLVVVKQVNGEFDQVLGIVEDVKVESKSNTPESIDISEL
ncbi:MAG: DUF4382 domain-containing protein [Bacteroidales bacterium]|nr:DUF4382 domain-containing protein [Bacteroidales bacterium]